ncbi:hypothetical protein [uncultured Deefgea sp.]|uniref:hypothetical protein n=1 Tax=uncultured Deefgea sp. TaxID=1304914 RepID=UPI0026294A09|nr:hypothetical protein [uncultured Deefgea sp.]
MPVFNLKLSWFGGGTTGVLPACGQMAEALGKMIDTYVRYLIVGLAVYAFYGYTFD